MCLSVIEINDYLDGLLSPVDVLRFEEHLSVCPSCSSSVDNYRLLISTVSNLPEKTVPLDFVDKILNRLNISEHPSFDLLSAYYDQMLYPEENIEISEHLELCSLCRNELQKISSQAESLVSLDYFQSSDDFLSRLLQKIDDLPEEQNDEVSENENTIYFSEHFVKADFCFSTEDLSAYIDRELTETVYQDLEKHLDDCHKCQSKHKNLLFSRRVTGQLSAPGVPFTFFKKVTEQIETEEKKKYFFQGFFSNYRKSSLVAGFLLFGILLTKSDFSEQKDVFLQANNASVRVVAEDYLFSGTNHPQADSLQVLSGTNSEDDLLMIQDIGF